MLQIRELSARTGVSAKTIRYYEAEGVLPAPRRAANGYREYDNSDVERLHFVRRARSLDFSLDEIAEILAFRDREEPPCAYVLGVMQKRIAEVEARIRDLEQLRQDLITLHEAGKALPEDALMQSCVCHLIASGSGE